MKHVQPKLPNDEARVTKNPLQYTATIFVDKEEYERFNRVQVVNPSDQISRRSRNVSKSQ